MDASLILLSAEQHLRAALNRVLLLKEHSQRLDANVLRDTVKEAEAAANRLLDLLIGE